MSSNGYTVEVTSLSPKATEEDVNNFFAFCGAIQHVEIVRAGEYASTAYVTFRNHHALETAVLLSGATIMDQPVCIARWGNYEDDYNPWNRPSWKIEDDSSPSHSQEYRSVPSAGEAVNLAIGVAKTMCIFGKDALGRAKDFDESYQVSSTAVAKGAELTERIGLADKLLAGVEAAKSVNQRYHVSDATKSAVSSVVNSSYFSKGALWVSEALSRAAQAAADAGNRGDNK